MSGEIGEFKKGEVYENTSPVLTIYGLQPKGVKMKSKNWRSMMSHPMNREQFNRTFKIIN